ncbi:MAG: 50S ribosomal protein L4 [bacterium]|nr:50S ribosomal protein L4 [bacterium]
MPVKKSPPKADQPVAEKVKETKTKKVTAKVARPRSVAVGLSVPVYSLEGKESGTLSLPKEIFGGAVNKVLLSQALRVYMNNQKTHFAHTKTRSEVKVSTRKIYRQKGTGGARHGARSAPIFVGGGVALGPKFRKVILDLPKKMKQKALLAALSSKVQAKEAVGIEGLDKASGKTSQMQKLMKGLSKNGAFLAKSNALLALGEKNDQVVRAARNLPGLDILPVEQLNALEVMSHQTLILTKEAVVKLSTKVQGEVKS